MEKKAKKERAKNKPKEPKTKMKLACDRLDKLLEAEGRGAAAKLAAALGVSSQAVTAYRYGTTDASLDTIIAMADYYGKSVDWFLGRTDENNWSADQTVREISSYTGLSSDAVEALHTWLQPNKFFHDRTKSWIKMLSKLIEGEGGSDVINELWVYLRLHESRGRYELYDAARFLNDPDIDHCRLGRYGDNEVFLQFGEAQVDLNMELIDRVQLDILTDAIREYRNKIWSAIEKENA